MIESRVRALGLFVTFAVAVAGCDSIAASFGTQPTATDWDGSVEEIIFKKLERHGDALEVELHSRIDAPSHVVWRALKKPEKLPEFSTEFEQATIVDEGDETKRISFLALALGKPQHVTIDFKLDSAAKIVTFETIETTGADVRGTYGLVDSPTGRKTLYVYKATVTDKASPPASDELQRRRVEESFLNELRAIKKQIGLG